jgi:hypothetical protein
MPQKLTNGGFKLQGPGLFNNTPRCSTVSTWVLPARKACLIIRTGESLALWGQEERLQAASVHREASFALIIPAGHTLFAHSRLSLFVSSMRTAWYLIEHAKARKIYDVPEYTADTVVVHLGLGACLSRAGATE